MYIFVYSYLFSAKYKFWQIIIKKRCLKMLGEGGGINHIFPENFIEILKSFGRYEDFLLQY